MNGKNWNSKKKEWSPVVKNETKEKAVQAKKMKSKGISVEKIAQNLNLSKSRIYELLK